MVDHTESAKATNYHILRSVVFGALTAVLVWEVVLSPGMDWWNNRTTGEQPVLQVEQGEVQTDVAAESIPVKLSIPAINLTAEFTQPLGIDQNTGEIEVPGEYDKVGWYKYSPSPGQLGPMIILGHVDSYTGPAVFYSIGQLETGDEVLVVGDDGVERTYLVERSVKFEQADFPTELVYGDTAGPELRLITCSGVFNQVTQRYTQNRVVYAKLKE